MADEYEVEESGPFWGNILAGVVIGLVVGGGLALLFAPKSGRELRGEIEESFDNLKERTEVALDNLQESAANLSERSKALLEQTRENLTRSVEAGKEAYQQKRQELTTQLESDASGV